MHSPKSQFTRCLTWFWQTVHMRHPLLLNPRSSWGKSKNSLFEVAQWFLTEGRWNLGTGSRSRMTADGESCSGTKRLGSCVENGGSESQPGGCHSQPLWKHVSQEAEESNTGIKTTVRAPKMAPNSRADTVVHRQTTESFPLDFYHSLNTHSENEWNKPVCSPNIAIKLVSTFCI